MRYTNRRVLSTCLSHWAFTVCQLHPPISEYRLQPVCVEFCFLLARSMEQFAISPTRQQTVAGQFQTDTEDASLWPTMNFAVRVVHRDTSVKNYLMYMSQDDQLLLRGSVAYHLKIILSGWSYICDHSQSQCLSTYYFLLLYPLVGVHSIAISLSVCLSVRMHLSKNFTKFSIHVTCGRGSFILWRQCEIRYVLPVLWITSYFHME